MGKFQKVLTAVGVMLFVCLIGASSAWAQPTANAGTDATTCVSEPTTLNGTATAGTGTSYTVAWTVQSGPDMSTAQFSSTTAEDPTFTPTATGSYVLRFTVTNNEPLTAFDDVAISVNASVTANAGSAATTCVGTAINLNGTAGGGDASYTFAWTVLSGPSSNSSQFSSTSAEDPTFTPIAAGPYVLRFTVNDGICAASFSDVNITVNAAVTADAGSAATTCVGQTISLNGTPGGGDATYTLAWTVFSGPDLGGGQFSSPSAEDPSFTPTAAGSYVLRFTVNDGICTAVFDDVNITVNAVVTANAGSDATICLGATTNLNGTAGGGDASYTFAWTVQSGPNTSTAQFSSATAEDPTFTPTLAGSYVLSFTVDDGVCTAASDNVTITVNPLPTATMSGTATICVGSSTTISTTLTGTPPWSVTWSDFVTQTNIMSSPFTRIVTPSLGITTYTVTAVSDANCTGTFSGSTVVTANPVVTANAGTDATTCVGEATTLNSTPGGGDGTYTFAWTVQSGPNTSTAQFSSATAEDPTFTPTAAGSYVLRFTANDGICTAAFDDVTITVNPVVTANAGADATICIGGTVNLNGTPGGGDASYTFAWTVQSGPNTSTTQFSSATSEDPTFTPTAVGSYVLRFTVNDGVCAAAFDDVTITVNPVITANAGADAITCVNQAVSLNGTPGGGDGSYTFAWTVQSGPNTSTTQFSSPSVEDPTFTPTATGSYVLRFTVNDGICTAAFDDVTITVNSVVTANAGADAAICIGGTVNLNGTPGGGDGTYTFAWTVQSGPNTSTAQFSSATAEDPTFTPTLAGSYVLRFTANDGVCTAAFDDVTITVNPLPTATVSGPASVCLGSSVTISAALTGTAPWNITWSDAVTQTGIMSSPATRSVSPSVATTYTVTAVSDANCTGTASNSIMIAINSLAAASINGPDPANTMTTYTYTATTSATSPGFIWSATGGVINGSNTGSSVSVTTGALGTIMTVNVTVTDGGTGCITSATKNVTVNPLAPPSPSNLTAITVSASQINLAWTDNSSNETYFKIERKTPQSGSTYMEIANVGANITSYSDNGLTSGIQYFYRVRAANNGGNSAHSNEASATTGTPIAAPSSLTATAVSSSQINLTWTDNASNETGFKIERKTPQSGGTYTEIATVLEANITGFFDNSVTSGTQYFYRVRAFNAGGNSAFSNEANATTPTFIAAPGNLTATAVSGSQINLAWTDNASNETGFKIERKTPQSGGTYAEIASLAANITGYSNLGLISGTSYFYRVRAFNAGGHSAYSNEAEATTLSNLPAAPNNLTATAVSTSQINLAWTDNASSETGFKVERKMGASGTYAEIASLGANITAYSNTGLTNATQYFYRVRAFNANGHSAYSNEAEGTTSSIVPNVPAAPLNLAATPVSTTQVNLSWSDNSTNEDGFKIERKTLQGTYAVIGTLGAGVTKFNNTGLGANTQYFYRVCAFNSASNSLNSNEANARTRMNGPSNLAATPFSSSQINLTWKDNTVNEASFEIERSATAGGPFSVVGTTAPAAGSGSTVSFSNTGLSASTQYFYRVRAINAFNVSTYSNVANATIPAPSSNLALNKTITASGTDPISMPTRCNDGNQVSFWRSNTVSNASPTAWLRVELGSSPVTVARVVIRWNQNYFAPQFDIQVSNDGVTFTTVRTNNAGTAAVQDMSFSPVQTRYVRALLRKQNLSSYRLVELEAYATGLISKQDEQVTTENAVIPESITLEQNYPNPFNPSTMISFSLPAGAKVSLKVVNVNGQEVATLVDGYRDQGVHRVTFKAARLPTGTYFAVLKAGDITQIKRMTLAK